MNIIQKFIVMFKIEYEKALVPIEDNFLTFEKALDALDEKFIKRLVISTTENEVKLDKRMCEESAIFLHAYHAGAQTNIKIFEAVKENVFCDIVEVADNQIEDRRKNSSPPSEGVERRAPFVELGVCKFEHELRIVFNPGILRKCDTKCVAL
jgi:hypothetical protein